jgi:ABC-type multidrug transport system fused ATPase/permease subunit
MKDNDNDNDTSTSGLDILDKILSFILTESFIESILKKALIHENMDENDKKIINSLISNSKQCNFKQFKIDFILILFIETAYTIDNIENKILLKCISAILFTNIRQVLSKQTMKYDKEEMKQLEKTIFEEFHEKIETSINKNIENCEYHDDSLVKNIFLESHANILNIYDFYRTTVKYLQKVMIIILIFIFIYPLLFKLKYGLIRNIFNTGFVVLYQMYVIKLFEFSNKKPDTNKTGFETTTQKICEFFENMHIITESDTMDKELTKIAKSFENLLHNTEFLNRYADPRNKKRYINSMKKYKIAETAVSIVINDSTMLLFLETIKPQIVNYIECKTRLYQKLNIVSNFASMLNIKPYNTSDTIVWRNNDEVQFVFELKNVTLEHMDARGVTNKIFDNINLKFEKGSSHFLYGNSGCGKTTLLNLLMKKMNQTSGSICFLGAHNAYTYFSIREYTRYLSCKTELFSNSIHYNLCYGIGNEILTQRKHDVKKSIIKYMTLFGLDKFIPVMRKKSARLLSTGQKQRVAIIRLLLHIIFTGVKLVCLDEFTSNVDNRNEAEIFKALLHLQKKYDFTMFYVSHNLSNMKYSHFNYQFNVNDFSVTKTKTIQNDELDDLMM